jgi:hypothetical protein
MLPPPTRAAGASAVDRLLIARLIAGGLLCVFGVLVFLRGFHDAASTTIPALSPDCEVVLRGDGAVIITPPKGAPPAIAIAPASSGTWSPSSSLMTCLRSAAPPGRPTMGLGSHVALALLLLLAGLPFLVPTLTSEDAEGKTVSTTRVVVYALVTAVVVNFMRRLFDGADVGEIGVDHWLTGLTGVGIAGKVAQSFSENRGSSALAASSLPSSPPTPDPSETSAPAAPKG